MFKKLTVGASLVLFCGIFWAFCPWFSTLKDLPPAFSCSCDECVCATVPNNEDCTCVKCVCAHSCCCNGCVDGCTGVDGDVCNCWTCDENGCSHDPGCPCPNCIPEK